MTFLTTTYGSYGAATGTPGRLRTSYSGEMREADAGWYLLGRRLYSPELRRFLAPDRASPFDGGGINRYAYCGGDPVNRIDPSGHTWLAWVGTLLGLTGGRTGALGTASPPRRSVPEATCTPVTLASTVAAVAETVSVAAAIGSPASTASGRPKTGSVFGWISMGSSASEGAQLSAPQTMSPGAGLAERPFGFMGPGSTGPGHGETPPNPNVTYVAEQDVPASRLKTSDTGWGGRRRQWIYGSHVHNGNSHIMAADSPITSNDVSELYPVLRNAGHRLVYVYSGAHGDRYGRDWHSRTGQRAAPDRGIFNVDTRFAAGDSTIDLTISVLDMGLMTKQMARDMLLHDGAHVFSSCYGAADPVVMEALGYSHITVYASQ